MDTNVIDVEHIEPQLNDKSFNHINNIATGAIVMFIENISIPKGIANYTIATITCIVKFES